MDSMMPASVALNMPSTAAEVTVGRPHWPAGGAEQGVRVGATPWPGPPELLRGSFPGGSAAPVMLQQLPASPMAKAGGGCLALTGVGDAKPGCHGQDLPPGVRPGLVAVRLGLAGEDAGARQHVAEQPHHHDGQDDLRGQRPGTPPASLAKPCVEKGGGVSGHAGSRQLSASPYREHLEDLDAEQDEAAAPPVAGQADGDIPQVLGKQDDQDDGAGGGER